MGYPFGRDFTLTFDPLVDDTALLAIPDQTPSIYIFTDTNPPTRATALAGTGAVKSFTSWTRRGIGFDIAVTAIDDPDPNSELRERLYYYAVNFRLTNSAQIQTVIRPLEMERVSAHHRRCDVTSQEVVEACSMVLNYKNHAQITTLIATIKQEVSDKLKDEGFRWAEIYDLDRLKPIITNGTIARIMVHERKNPGDTFDQNFNFYDDLYKSGIKSIQLKIDKALDGRTPPKKQATYSNIVLR